MNILPLSLYYVQYTHIFVFQKLLSAIPMLTFWPRMTGPHTARDRIPPRSHIIHALVNVRLLHTQLNPPWGASHHGQVQSKCIMWAKINHRRHGFIEGIVYIFNRTVFSNEEKRFCLTAYLFRFIYCCNDSLQIRYGLVHL